MSWLRGLIFRRRMYSELSEEIREHLEEKIEELVAEGMPRKVAEAKARKEFGNVTLLEERGREVWQWPRLETFIMDVRYALRMLRKSPGFTAVAVLTLALGIGASTAVFSLVNAVLLKPLPYPQADRIVFPWNLPPRGVNVGFDIVPTARAAYLYFEQQSKTFASLGAFQSDSFNLTGSSEPLHLDGLDASAGFFPSLGVAPILGRTFTDAEDRPGNEHEVVLSYSLWHSQFGADPGILGRAIELNGLPYTVIGVMPRGFAFPRANEMPAAFSFPSQIQVWVPLALYRGPFIPAEPSSLAVVGRLKPGVTLAQAQDEMDIMAKNAEGLFPPNWKGSLNSKVTPLASQIAGGTGRPLLLTLGAVAVLLLLACANVAGLLITRSLGRRREFILRAALGAGHSRLIRQLLTESCLLASAGGIGGLAVGEGGIYFARNFGPAGIPRLGEAGLDIRVLAFTFGVMVIAALIFGFAPAIGVTRESLAESLKEGGQRSGTSLAARQMRNALLISQMALALVLVVAAGLLARTFYRLLQVDPGFRADHVLTFQLSLPPAKYPDRAHIVPAYQAVLQRIESLPGVRSAGIAEASPMGGPTDETGIRMPGQAVEDQVRKGVAYYTVTSSGYFAAAGTPILRGHGFLDTDTANSLPVAVISESMAKRYWPGGDPLGKQVGPGALKYPVATIIGIVADTKRLSLREEPFPEMYVPETQTVWPSLRTTLWPSLQTMEVVVRTATASATMTASVQDAVHAVDPDLPVAGVKLLSTIVAESMTEPRFSMLLLAGFAALALALAAIGMYGVVSYGVAQRIQEIGIRMALGAQRGSVFQMILGQGARLAAFGIGIGLAAAFTVTRLMRSFLYGIRATDPLTFVSVVILLMLVALAACYIPARRAMKVDPMVALRYE